MKKSQDIKEAIKCVEDARDNYLILEQSLIEALEALESLRGIDNEVDSIIDTYKGLDSETNCHNCASRLIDFVCGDS